MTSKRLKTTGQTSELPPSSPAACQLRPEEVAGWTVLQNMVLTEPGVCTDIDLFYRKDPPHLVSDSSAGLTMEGRAVVRLDTAFNVLPLQAMVRACRIGRLAVALSGYGAVEVTVFQSFAARSRERLLSETVVLSPDAESVFELADDVLIRRDGMLWLEFRAMDADERAVRVASARFLTDSKADPALRLAICRPHVDPTGLVPDAELDRLADWAARQGGRVSVLTCGGGAAAAPGLISLKPEPDSHAAHLALLSAARAQGFTHVVMLDPGSLIGPEALSRTLTCLSLLKDGPLAFGAATLDKSDAWLLADNGVQRQPDDRLVPVSAQVDLRNMQSILEIFDEALEASDEAPLIAQSGFLAFPLAALTGDPAGLLQRDRVGAEALSTFAEGTLQVNPMPGLLIRRDMAGRPAIDLMALQNLIFPEKGICTEVELFFHGHGGPVAHDDRADVVTIHHGAIASFDGYFNAFSVGKWHANTTMNGLWLGVSGRGRAEIKVFHAIPDRSWEVLATTIVTLSKAGEALIDLSTYPQAATTGVIFFDVRALSGDVVVSGARYLTAAQPDTSRKLALSITTFKREEQVEHTARRLAHYLDRCDFSAQMDCFIVDNGNSAKIIDHPKIRRIPNANLGGAGGFTRGLLEAEAQGYSHVLFMDDDASIPMEALHRTYAFLTLARDPKAAIAGAMINNTDKWRMWENGAVFDQKCKPLFSGTDLRDRQQMFAMEYESARTRSTKMYGGWWFFAFPVAQVRHHPFPFFVRGDDVNFSLANEFAITTLNGVVSFADDFIDKESPLTWYLDLRSHMVHHLTLDKMEVGPRALAWIGVSFFLRNIVKFQYETLEAVLMAWEHVLKGPEFFTQNADASGPRAAIKALVKTEAWQPLADLDTTEKAGFLDKRLGLRRRFYPFSLNGHFLPFYRFWGSRRVIPAWQRGHIDAAWGAYQLTFMNSTRDKGYVTRRNNIKALRLLTRLVAIWLRTVLGYRGLRAKYHGSYDRITTRDYWRGALSMPKVTPGE